MALPTAPRKSQMTFWSRGHPARHTDGSPDHWAKLKLKSNVYYRLESDRLQKLSTSNTGQDNNSAYSNKQIKSPSKLQSLDDILKRESAGTQRSYDKARKESLRTSYNDMAKEGYKYWPMERPKPTKFGRYTLGSYKTVLGIKGMS